MMEENKKKMYSEDEVLKRTMKSRHLTMIAIGGTIGSGLFMGSGAVINQAGPLGSVLAFFIGGIVMFLALLSLGEMAVAMPISGSFQAYATRFISPCAGFFTGWLYYLNWGTAGAMSLIAASMIMTNWFPMMPEWTWCILFGALLAFLNIMSAKTFGETEFWFASIKVVAIVVFVVLGAAIIFGIDANTHVNGFANFYKDGWFPLGIAPIFFTMVIVVTSFQGAELVGIAAGESENPEKNIRSAVKNVGLRIMLFYIFAIVVLVGILPWKEAGVEESPFAKVFGMIGIPHAYDIMSFVVVTSCLSSVNSAIYACSRLLWSAAHQQLAPSLLKHTNKAGVPVFGVIATVMLMMVALLSKTFAAAEVFMWITSATGFIGCIVWIVIAVCHISFRKKYLELGHKLEDLKFRVPMAVPVLGILANCVVIVGMYIDPTLRIVVYSGIISLLLIVLCYYIFVSKAARVKIKGWS
ncbi:MAG: amino acid permease [Negativicutes bacterium]|jgi:amino acid permease